MKVKKKASIAALKKKLDKVFNSYIRKRDENTHPAPGLYFTCISCQQTKDVSFMHAGHFYASTFTAVRWDERNVNGQCAGCNVFKHGNLL